jgi:tetraacyldisaccharide 4'-kinase
MRLADWWQRKIADDAEGDSLLARAVQGALAVASVPYGIGASANRTLHRFGILPTLELGAPVLSVGNITMGGTGKTPFVEWLCRHLREHEGHRPAVLARGYGRRDEGALTIVHDGRRMRAGVTHAGDEPVLLAKRLGDVPVLACADRWRAGSLALTRLRATALVLDDGFQHHRLHREGDIVLVDGTRDLYRLELTPRGTLREPLSALAHAHLIAITRWDLGGEKAMRLAKRLRRDFPGVPLVRVRFATAGVRMLEGDGSLLPAESLAGRKAALISAVGNPQSVALTAKRLGLRIVAAKFLPDHAPISSRMVREIEARARERGADLVITTEKDEVKLPPAAKRSGRWGVMPLAVEFVSPADGERAAAVIRARLASRGARALLEG